MFTIGDKVIVRSLRNTFAQGTVIAVRYTDCDQVLVLFADRSRAWIDARRSAIRRIAVD
jgi:hypothetical protein